jgi:hypothetical protein
MKPKLVKVKKAKWKLFTVVVILSLLAPVSILPSQPITVEAQEAKSGNITSPSTVWREYPYLPPLLVETDTHYIYVTDWGNYTFSKEIPYVCAYTSRNMTKMVSFSTFWVNTSKIVLPIQPYVLTANDTTFIVQVDVYRWFTKVAVLTQEWDFNRAGKPKISVSLEKTRFWNLDAFNIFWVVAGFRYIKQNETSCKDTKSELTYWKEGIIAEMGNSSSPNEWSEWLIVDWGDEGIAKIYYGEIELFNRKIAGLAVFFNINDSEIDPALVATSTSSTATHTPSQRLSFYANGRHWVFYSDGSFFGWRTSTDGITWSDFTAITTQAYGVLRVV